jgi:hypothetical protein
MTRTEQEQQSVGNKRFQSAFPSQAFRAAVNSAIVVLEAERDSMQAGFKAKKAEWRRITSKRLLHKSNFDRRMTALAKAIDAMRELAQLPGMKMRKQERNGR